jgi:hypothetical protein
LNASCIVINEAPVGHSLKLGSHVNVELLICQLTL